MPRDTFSAVLTFTMKDEFSFEPDPIYIIIKLITRGMLDLRIEYVYGLEMNHTTLFFHFKNKSYYKKVI